MRIVITPIDPDATSYAGKLADAELHFTDGPLAGLKLIGFAIWAPRTVNGKRSVTYPARTYSVNGERRSFALLRPTGGATLDQLASDIIAAYDEFLRPEPQLPLPIDPFALAV